MKSAFVLILAVLILIIAVVLAGYQERRDTLFEVSRLAAPPEFPTPPSPCPESGEKCPEFQGDARLRRIANPVVIRRVEPRLTAAARKHKIAGVVIVQAGIRRDGTVGGVCVLKTLPCGLSEAAVSAVKQWRFERQEADGVANVAVHFPAASTTF